MEGGAIVRLTVFYSSV